MHRSVMSYSIGVAAMVFGLAACSSDSGTGPDLSVPDSEINQSIASDAGDAIATAVDLMASNEDSYANASRIAAAGGIASVSPDVTVLCTGPDNDGWFTCDRTTWHGLDLLRQKRFWEGTSFGLGFDPAKTDSVNHRHTLTGTFNPAWNPARTIWVDRADTASMVVDRAANPVQHIWDRVGQRNDSSAYELSKITRTFHYTAYDTAAAVVFDLPRSQHVWPMSGTVIHNITTLFTAQSNSRSISRTVLRRVEVTFNGTSHVPLQVGDLTCDLDLETHAVTGCH